MGKGDLSGSPDQDKSANSDSGDRDERPVAGASGKDSTDSRRNRRDRCRENRYRQRRIGEERIPAALTGYHQSKEAGEAQHCKTQQPGGPLALAG